MHHHWVTSGLTEVQHSYGITCSHLFCRPMNEPALEPVDKRFVEQSRILWGHKQGTNTRPLSHFHLICWASQQQGCLQAGCGRSTDHMTAEASKASQEEVFFFLLQDLTPSQLQSAFLPLVLSVDRAHARHQSSKNCCDKAQVNTHEQLWKRSLLICFSSLWLVTARRQILRGCRQQMDRWVGQMLTSTYKVQ